MNIDDILVKIIPNGSQMDSCTVTSLTRTDSNFLTGGELNMGRVNLEYNATPMEMNSSSLNLPVEYLFTMNQEISIQKSHTRIQLCYMTFYPQA